MCTRLSNPRRDQAPRGTLGEQAACHTFARPTSKPRPVASPGNTSPICRPARRVSRGRPTPIRKLDATSAVLASHLPISSELDPSRRRVRSFPTRAVVFSVWVHLRTRPARSRGRGMPGRVLASACEANAAILTSLSATTLRQITTRDSFTSTAVSASVTDVLRRCVSPRAGRTQDCATTSFRIGTATFTMRLSIPPCIGGRRVDHDRR
jgi:hypothetical protein